MSENFEDYKKNKYHNSRTTVNQGNIIHKFNIKYNEDNVSSFIPNKLEEQKYLDCSEIKNVSSRIKEMNPRVEESNVSCFFKINYFREFLDMKLSHESEEFEFYLPRFDINLLGKAIIFPADENFSVQVSFLEDTKKNYLEQDDLYSNYKNHYNSDHLRLNSNSLSNPNSINNFYLKTFSSRLSKIFSNNEVSFDATYSVYNSAKKYFMKNRKEKFNLNETNYKLIENFLSYEDLVYEKLVDPFIFKISLVAQPKTAEKCEEFNGIVNEGNTCYLNTILQSLYHLKSIRKSIYKLNFPEDTRICELQKLFLSLQNEKEAISAINFFKSLDWEKSFWNSQQDFQEIFSYLFLLISNTEKCFQGQGKEGFSKIEDALEGIVTTQIKCIDSNYESKKEEKFLFLELDIENKSNLVECIESFLSVEFLSEENKYETDDKIKHDAIKNFSFKKLPEILFIHMKRFKYDASCFKINKLHSELEYPNEVDFSPYISSNADGLIYSLYSVIVHDGTTEYGHYYCFIKDFLKKKWIKFNDKSVTIADYNDVFNKNFGGGSLELFVDDNGEICTEFALNKRTAYILIYVNDQQINKIFKELNKDDVNIFLK